MKTFLTIAGSDPSGGAGIQADIKTASAFGLYAMSAITAVTVQNTQGVKSVYNLDANLVYDQISAVADDIFPDCVKIGMCADEFVTEAVAEAFKRYRFKNTVLDTIILSSSGHELLSTKGIEIMKEKLFPQVDIITPNIPEAELLTGIKIDNEIDMVNAAKSLNDKYGCSVILKGGHLNGNDLFFNGKPEFFCHSIIDNHNTHGTGCTLSSAAASLLAQGKSESEASRGASEYVYGAIEYGLDLGKGNGPLYHFYTYKNKI